MDHVIVTIIAQNLKIILISISLRSHNINQFLKQAKFDNELTVHIRSWSHSKLQVKIQNWQGIVLICSKHHESSMIRPSSVLVAL